MDQKRDTDYGHKILDENFYYYQTKAGTVSKTPLSIRQLARLLCPVREGLNPILPSNTQCLPVIAVAQDNGNEEGASYGEWKAATQIEILREASCSSWFWTIQGSPAEGPGSCRKLLQVILTHGDIKNSKVMVFAKDITPEWTTVSRMKQMPLILLAIQNNNTSEKGQVRITVENSKESAAESKGAKETASDKEVHDVQHELEAFLSSAAEHSGVGDFANKKQRDDEDHLYESDGGTRYVKDPLSDNWIHEALAPPKVLSDTNKKGFSSSGTTTSTNSRKKSSSKKSKKAKFSKRHAKLWIYISGLPTQGVTADDLQRYFSKAGLLDLDPETLKPKVKLYRDNSTGKLKGDASIRYARSESVELALEILDNSLWDKDHCIKVERAKFQEKGEDGKERPNRSTNENENSNDSNMYLKRKRPISEAQRKVARLALLQAQDEGFGGRLAGGRKGLCIIVVKNMMDGIPENELENVMYKAFQEFGSIEKITCISKTRVVIVKYGEPIAASTAINALNGTPNPRTEEKMEAIYWDGITDYTTLGGEEEKEKEEEERRHEEFGDWLESQEELPPELQLQVAQD